jgi:hypothetical protein
MPVIIDGTNGITQAGEFNSDSSFGFKNRIINGAMVIDQRNAGASVTVNSGSSFFIADRWLASGISADGVFTGQQVTTAPTGFNNSLQFTVTTADASIGATQNYTVRQRIEGYNFADLGWGTANAKTITISFWVRSSLTGTFGGALFNEAGDRAYAFSFSISSADTFEYKTITIAGDTTGTWSTTNGTALNLVFSLGVGSTYKGTAGVWGSTFYFAPTGSVDLISTLNATFYITGVQLEVGSTATSFDYRPYGTELALCQRYFYKVTNGGNDNPICMIAGYSTGTGVGVGYGVLSFPVIMRTAPDIYQVTGTNYFRFSGDGTNLTFDSFTYNERSITGITLSNNSSLSASATVGYAYWCRANNANAVLGFSAEL